MDALLSAYNSDSDSESVPTSEDNNVTKICDVEESPAKKLKSSDSIFTTQTSVVDNPDDFEPFMGFDEYEIEVESPRPLVHDTVPERGKSVKRYISKRERELSSLNSQLQQNTSSIRVDLKQYLGTCFTQPLPYAPALPPQISNRLDSNKSLNLPSDVHVQLSKRWEDHSKV